MAVRVGINGYGRIGRNILRALYESEKREQIEIVGINDLGDAETNAHLTKYDSAYGTFKEAVTIDNDALVIGADKIKVFSERNPADIPWGDLGVDVVHECTGLFTNKKEASKHIESGASKVLISAPAGKDVDATVVYGVNHQILKPKHTVVSNASCTTNCLAPLVQPLHKKIGVESGIMTTVHAYTNDQVLTDIYHNDLRRARSATQSMIPTKTGAATAVGLVLPELMGKLDGYAIRVPTIIVSLVDLTFKATRKTSPEEIDDIIRTQSEGTLEGILGFNDTPLVSIDFKKDPRSSVYDRSQTKVLEGDLVKVISWYDNEWGFSNRMLDTTLVMAAI
ncbi:MAG: type I glyceraldehyde-3-phosphate dehydrogenase [Pseudomonadota bacterium]|nr:type I glyceraldehyde-3-phosphate dehydrogenase [Pseudomonadota bacterium]